MCRVGPRPLAFSNPAHWVIHPVLQMRRPRLRKILERRTGKMSLGKRKTNSSPSPLSLRAPPQAPLTPWEGHILSVCLSPTPDKGPQVALCFSPAPGIWSELSKDEPMD